MDKRYYTYILTNKSGTLYIGITNDLRKRVYQHKQKQVDGFTKKYNINRLLWYQSFSTALQAIRVEKKLKGWTRAKKTALINETNPEWNDLSEGWYSSIESCS